MDTVQYGAEQIQKWPQRTTDTHTVSHTTQQAGHTRGLFAVQTELCAYHGTAGTVLYCCALTSFINTFTQTRIINNMVGFDTAHAEYLSTHTL
jgi:hypothetical protein